MGRRGREAGLLLIPMAFVGCGLAILSVGDEGSGFGAAQLGAFVAATIAAHIWLSWRFRSSDQLLVPIVLCLAAVGVVMVTRLEPEFGQRQVAWIGLGVAAMLATPSLLPSLSWLRSIRYSCAVLGLVLVLLTFLFGADPGASGARLWLGVSGVYFQPSEILKLLLVIFFASYLDDYREVLSLGALRLGPLRLPPLPYLAPLVTMLTLAILVLIFQRDLGPSLLFFGVFVAMLYVATARLGYVAGGLVFFGLGLLITFRLFDHFQTRVNIWLDPWADPQGSGHQIIQGLIGLASGGLLGAGLAEGYPEYVPAVHTDLIIAAIGEELGLLGSVAVVMLFVLLVYRGFSIAVEARDSFASLLATGLTSVLALQALVILMGSLKLTPLTGVTLPFVSYGGSSLLVNFIMIGLLLAVSNQRSGSRV